MHRTLHIFITSNTATVCILTTESGPWCKRISPRHTWIEHRSQLTGYTRRCKKTISPASLCRHTATRQQWFYQQIHYWKRIIWELPYKNFTTFSTHTRQIPKVSSEHRFMPITVSVVVITSCLARTMSLHVRRVWTDNYTSIHTHNTTTPSEKNNCILNSFYCMYSYMYY